jgi:Zn-dependent protease with chaperone function
MEIMKRRLFLLFFIAASFTAAAQLQPVYNFLRDDTVVKKNYFEKALQQKNTAISSITKQNKDDYKKIYESRFEEIEDLLTSSRSLTAAGAHHYLQAVLQKIIAVNPELKGLELRVIFSRDWWPNAYSMGDGTIAVNAGLFVFLANEAELVFILCHELSHYYLDHSGKSINKYVETINSEGFQKELKRLSKEEYRVNEQVEKLSKSLVFDSRKHSRNNEAEADLQAFRFMRKTGYNCHAIISTLQLLNKADDTSLFKPLNIEQAFHFNEYPFKKKWIQKESAIFSELNEKDSPLSRKEKDSLKTHPDCSKRILLLEDSINKTGNAGKLFLVDERLFKKLNKDFLAEITEECYEGKNLSRNLYYSLLLLQAGENMPMAAYSVARCLNELYQKQQQHRLGLTIDMENKRFPGDYNLLLRLLAKLRLDEIAAINYYFCRRYQEQMKDYTGFAEEMNKASRLKN